LSWGKGLPRKNARNTKNQAGFVRFVFFCGPKILNGLFLVVCNGSAGVGNDSTRLWNQPIALGNRSTGRWNGGTEMGNYRTGVWIHRPSLGDYPASLRGDGTGLGDNPTGLGNHRTGMTDNWRRLTGDKKISAAYCALRVARCALRVARCALPKFTVVFELPMPLSILIWRKSLGSQGQIKGF